jgi:hypothetical protein
MVKMARIRSLVEMLMSISTVGLMKIRSAVAMAMIFFLAAVTAIQSQAVMVLTRSLVVKMQTL